MVQEEKWNVYYLKNINYNKVIDLFFLSISKVCANLICSGGIWGICPGGICPGGMCPRGYMSRGVSVRGVSVQGVSVQGGICPGVSVQGVSVPGGYVLRATNMFLWFQCKFYAQSYDGRPNGLRSM